MPVKFHSDTIIIPSVSDCHFYSCWIITVPQQSFFCFICTRRWINFILSYLISSHVIFFSFFLFILFFSYLISYHLLFFLFFLSFLFFLFFSFLISSHLISPYLTLSESESRSQSQSQSQSQSHRPSPTVPVPVPVPVSSRLVSFYLILVQLLRDFTRFGGKTSARLGNTGPGVFISSREPVFRRIKNTTLTMNK